MFCSGFQGYKPIKTCQEFSHDRLHSHPPELSLAPMFPLALLSQCYCYSPCLLPVSGPWQLVSITLILRALGCVRMMVHQQVTTAERSFTLQTFLPSRPTNPHLMSRAFAQIQGIFVKNIEGEPTGLSASLTRHVTPGVTVVNLKESVTFMAVAIKFQSAGWGIF